MIATQVIERLQGMVEKYGDKEVMIWDYKTKEDVTLDDFDIIGNTLTIDINKSQF